MASACWQLVPAKYVVMLQADAYARSQGLQLVGYYQANERIDDQELGPAGRKVADRIHSQTSNSAALLVRQAY